MGLQYGNRVINGINIYQLNLYFGSGDHGFAIKVVL